MQGTKSWVWIQLDRSVGLMRPSSISTCPHTKIKEKIKDKKIPKTPGKFLTHSFWRYPAFKGKHLLHLFLHFGHLLPPLGCCVSFLGQFSGGILCPHLFSSPHCQRESLPGVIYERDPAFGDQSRGWKGVKAVQQGISLLAFFSRHTMGALEDFIKRFLLLFIYMYMTLLLIKMFKQC